MSSRPATDTERRAAKRLKKLAEEETGMRPKHCFCLRLVQREPRNHGESTELFVARLFDAFESELRASAAGHIT